MTNNRILTLGRVQRAKGFDGQIRITGSGELLTGSDVPVSVDLYSAVTSKDGFLTEPRPCGSIEISEFCEIYDDYFVVRCKGITTVEQITKIKGSWLGMPLDEARKQFGNPDDPWLFEYIGIKIIEPDGEFGEVTRVEEFGPAAQLVVLDKNGDEVLLPLESPFIEKTDLKSGVIHTRNIRWLNPDYED